MSISTYAIQHSILCSHMKTEYVVIKIVSARSLIEAIIHRLALWTFVRLRSPIMLIREPLLIFRSFSAHGDGGGGCDSPGVLLLDHYRHGRENPLHGYWMTTIVSIWQVFALGGLTDLLHPDANYDSRFCFGSGPTNDMSIETEYVLSSSNHVPRSVSK